MSDYNELQKRAYRGKFVEKLQTDKKRLKAARHPIFLYHPDFEDQDALVFDYLEQVVNVYEHNEADFEVNAKHIIDHYRKSYGNLSNGLMTLGQSICFRVEKHGEIFDLPLFAFFLNYILLIIPILCGDDMSDWKPWRPNSLTPKGIDNQINYYLKRVRDKVNIRRADELIELIHYLMSLFAVRAGNRLGLSISNNDFIELTKRSKDAYESITCTFDIPEGISPTDLEKLTMDRTRNLLKFIGEQIDLPISVYAKNNLFNPTQFREFAVHITHKPDLSGNTIPYTYPTNIIMGTKDPRAFAVDAYGGRKAEITKLNVSDAGTLERSLSMLLSGIQYVDPDPEHECHSKHFRKRIATTADDLVKLDGRVATLDPDSDEYFIIDPDDMSILNKQLYIKTPITCTHPLRSKGYICSACYGKLMTNINCDVHVGRIAALQSADDMEQTLLSAKHALNTNTSRVEFDEVFYDYFELGNTQITLSEELKNMSAENDKNLKHLFLEFYPHSMGKNQDGEGRHYDRSIDEIVIYNDQDDSRISIRELNGTKIFLSPEFNNEFYLPAAAFKDAKDVVRVCIDDMIDTGELLCEVVFEFSYKNTELASALLTLQNFMDKGNNMNSFSNYDECLDTLGPLFVKGGIHLPDYQFEMIVGQMIFTEDNKRVDWNDPHPKYKFCSINKSIQNSDSVLTSILYRESTQQIAGAYGSFDKTGTSAYDYFLLDRR